MALELETDILLKVGLGRHFNWSNGSVSCIYVRKAAIEKLPQAIQAAHDADPTQIIPPYQPMMELYHDAAQVGDMYTLTVAWRVASDVIRAHMDAVYTTDPQKRTDQLDNTVMWLRKHYNLPSKREREAQRKTERYYSLKDFLWANDQMFDSTYQDDEDEDE